MNLNNDPIMDAIKFALLHVTNDYPQLDNPDFINDAIKLQNDRLELFGNITKEKYCKFATKNHAFDCALKFLQAHIIVNPI